jgi:putative membrane protein
MAHGAVTRMLRFALIGAAIGIANVIPGVSGGTIAVVFGVYERLISLVTFRLRRVFSERQFWLPLVIGAGAGIIVFSKVMTFLFERFPAQTAWCFIGIVAGSVPMLWTRMIHGGGEKTAARAPAVSAVIAAVIACAAIVALSFFSPEGSRRVQTAFSFSLAAVLFASGALGAIAMIIPGISGSFFLVVIGTYATIIAAVSDFNIPLLIPTGLGVALGLLCGAALIRVLLRKAPRATYGAIFGLVAGSAAAIFPGAAFDSLGAAAGSILCCAAGFALSFAAGRKRPAEQA